MSKEASNDSTFRPALQLMSGRAAAFAVTFFIPVLLAHIFTPAEFGTYKQLFVIVYTLYGIGQIGMAESLFYFLPTFPREAGKFVTNSVIMLALTGLACLAGLTFFGHRVAHALAPDNQELPSYIWAAGAYLFLMLTACALEIVMISRKRYRWATATYACSDLVRGACFLLPAFLTRNLTWLMVGGLTFCALRVATLIVYVRKEFKGELGFDAQRLKQQFMYTVPFASSVLIEVIQANYHQFAVSSHFDTTMFAIYSIGCLQIPLVDFMASPASNVMMVRMGEQIRDGRQNNLLSIWHDTSRKLALVFFPLVALLIVNAFRIITLLFPPMYAASVPIFMVWSLTILFSVLQTDGVLRVFAKTRFLFLMNVTRLIAIVSLMNWFLNRFSLIGAVLVTLAGVCIAKTMALVRIKTLLHVPISHLMPWLSLGGIGIVAMLAAIPSGLISQHLRLPSIYVLPISGMIYVSVYAALLLFLGLLNEGEKRAITDVIARFTGLRARRAE
jgi:O-antigen/teichoic acid export membrane protein